MCGRVITLLTDFGTADGYVAEMIGVMLTMTPDARIVSVSHDIPPQDIARARLTLSRYWLRFPRGTVHVVVVDPGVGTSRAAIAVESDDRFCVGPDNGVLSPAIVHGGSKVVRLDVPDSASRTFHGRDVFAPAAARLAHSEPLAALGHHHQASVIMDTPAPVRDGKGAVTGVVIAIDRFGNAITNIDAAPSDSLVAAGRVIPVVRTFADVDVGDACALVGSAGLIEVVVRDGNAAQVLGLDVGTPVVAGTGRHGG